MISTGKVSIDSKNIDFQKVLDSIEFRQSGNEFVLLDRHKMRDGDVGDFTPKAFDKLLTIILDGKMKTAIIQAFNNIIAGIRESELGNDNKMNIYFDAANKNIRFVRYIDTHKTASYIGTSISLNDLISSAKLYNELSSTAASIIRKLDETVYLAESTADSFKYIFSVCNNVNMTINTVSRIIDKSYIEVSEDYYGAADTLEKIGKFTELSIKNGAVPKNIVATLKNLLPDDMMGEKQKAGNSRYIIFPTNKEYQDRVIKIAYNGFGLYANKIESKVSAKIEEHPTGADGIQMSDIVAMVSEISDGFGAIAMERV